MITDILWWDNDPDMALAGKVRSATQYYEARFGEAPDRCLVHPSMLTERSPWRGKVEVLPSPYVLPNYVWVVRVTES